MGNAQSSYVALRSQGPERGSIKVGKGLSSLPRTPALNKKARFKNKTMTRLKTLDASKLGNKASSLLDLVDKSQSTRMTLESPRRRIATIQLTPPYTKSSPRISLIASPNNRLMRKKRLSLNISRKGNNHFKSIRHQTPSLVQKFKSRSLPISPIKKTSVNEPQIQYVSPRRTGGDQNYGAFLPLLDEYCPGIPSPLLLALSKVGISTLDDIKRIAKKYEMIEFIDLIMPHIQISKGSQYRRLERKTDNNNKYRIISKGVSSHDKGSNDHPNMEILKAWLKCLYIHSTEVKKSASAVVLNENSWKLYLSTSEPKDSIKDNFVPQPNSPNKLQKTLPSIWQGKGMIPTPIKASSQERKSVK